MNESTIDPISEEAAEQSKKLTLNKETVQELSDEQLEDVAGGLLGTKGHACRDQTFKPACPDGDIYLSRLFTCGCPPSQVLCP